ncbi:MAG: dihydropteroate synthase [Actinomycetota bacterium]|nr:dihydropteroate synthase [Actinomycetota bacterium]
MSAASQTLGKSPLVRVIDASLVLEGGPVRVTISGMSSPHRVAESLAGAGIRATVEDGRLTTTSTLTRLVDAVGAVLGLGGAEALAGALDVAVAAWHGPAPELVTSAGALDGHRRPTVMGILNVTPDSFSDGGHHYDPDRHPHLAIGHGKALAAAGADVVDVGGESTRPGAEAVPEDEELRRVLPVVEALAADGLIVSIDTSKASVARAAVEAGAAIVNDVSGGALDGLLLPTVAELGVPYVLMHMRGTPRTMQRNPVYADVVAEVFDFLGEGLQRCIASGIDPRQIVVDPGIGFGKTVDHNLLLLRRVRELTSLGRPVLVGTSRKSFLGRVGGGLSEQERLEGSLATAALAVANGAAIVRAHDVRETVRVVRVAHAVATGEWAEE